MRASDSRTGFRQRLLDLIDQSGVTDWHLSRLATGSSDTVRNIRRGATPHVNTIEALLRCLGFRLQIAPLDAADQLGNDVPAVEKPPDWARQLREEFRQDLAEALGRDDKELWKSIRAPLRRR